MDEKSTEPLKRHGQEKKLGMGDLYLFTVVSPNSVSTSMVSHLV